MLGEANLMYATRRYKEASRLLMEVIKAAPNAADPYQTLGLVHEADGDPRRALDLYMIAAHLTPKVGGRGGVGAGPVYYCRPPATAAPMVGPLLPLCLLSPSLTGCTPVEAARGVVNGAGILQVRREGRVVGIFDTAPLCPS